MNKKIGENLGLSKSKFLRVPIEEPNRIVDTAELSFRNNGYVHFVSFWGVSSKKQKSDSVDHKAISFLNLILAQLSYEFGAPCKLTLLLGDTHGRANYIDQLHVANYLSDIQNIANTYNIRSVFLSTIFNGTGSNFESNFMLDNEIREVYTKNSDKLLEAALATGTQEKARERSARYLTIRLREKAPIEKDFPHSILIANERPRNQYLLPDLPTIFCYATKSGNNKKAWFTKESEQFFTCVE